MSDQTAPLTDEERAELEQLRAEKAARVEAERARQERAELERLRAEKAAAQERRYASQAAEDERMQEARERGRRLMEPGDDLSMPTGQKIVLVAIALIVIAVIATIVFGPK